jgi:hypothetical protein
VSIFKLRGLDKFGVVTDVDGFDLPPQAWSYALNVRFKDGRVQSAPVWRGVAALEKSSPRYTFTANLADRGSSTYVGYLDGTVNEWTPSNETAVSPTGYSTSEAESTWSSCTLAEVTYVNREDRTLWARGPSDVKFSVATNWDSGWRAKIIRSYASSLIALNVTKSGVRYPTMVKTSDIVTDPGVQPPSWDHTDPTTNAVENPLTEMIGEILDAHPLGGSLIIYSGVQAWLMTADNSEDVYSFRKLPFNAGVINTNCVAEVESKHYGFGPDDIWMHDGMQKVSIVSGKQREHIFRTMNAKQADRFFVAHNEARKELSFCYLSGDEHVSFNGKGCNRAFVYNYENQTGSFDDLPLVFASTYATVTLSEQTWENTTDTWATVGGTWADLEDGFKKSPLFVGETSGPHSLTATMYARDPYGDGSSVSRPVDENATRGSLLERTGIDLDDLDANLSGYKHILAIYPQGRLDSDAAPMEFSFATVDYANQPYVWSATQTYDAGALYKCDYTDGGRFLGIRMNYPDFRTMSLSGMDLDIEVTGER